jgi:predicted metalloendopeptidase
VNAYYNPNMNEIVFPAGILQPPFFWPNADDAVNYGAIGVVIGHEMTHGFDDQGSQYDAEGNLRNWWTEADKKAYEARTDLVARQFDGYQPFPDAPINGKLTLGENIADLGGLKIAWAALGKAIGQDPNAAPAVDGFTPGQRFFLSYANVWRDNIRDEALRVRLATDPHSPGRYRVVGPLSNLPEFQVAFSCPEGAPMRRPEAERPAIW